jgi:hypothetical protein
MASDFYGTSFPLVLPRLLQHWQRDMYHKLTQLVLPALSLHPGADFSALPMADTWQHLEADVWLQVSVNTTSVLNKSLAVDIC